MATVTFLQGDALENLKRLPADSVHCVVTSPPYWALRCYGVDGQLGLEPTPEEHIAVMVELFREVRRVLRPDGCLWLNYGDGYATGGRTGGQSNSEQAVGKPCDGFRDSRYLNQHQPQIAVSGLKAKDLIGMPWRVALALQADGWWLRSDCIWHKPNPLPESVTDRPTKAHEYMFLLTKSPRYFYDADAVREKSTGIWNSADMGKRPKITDGKLSKEQRDRLRYQGVGTYHEDRDRSGRNLRTVWTIPTQAMPDAHFATFPERLVLPCVKAGTSERGCCPECGGPWERVSEDVGPKTVTKKDLGRSKLEVGTRGLSFGRTAQVVTTGWQPTCTCDAGEPVPCTVLDPFMGSGTTCWVAAKNNRDAIGIELNPEYIEIARKRLEGDMFVTITEGSDGHRGD